MNDLERRMSGLEDKMAIQEIMGHYCYYIDHLDHEMLGRLEDLLSDDVIADYGILGKIEGKKAIEAFFADYLAGKTNFRFWYHVLHTGYVEIEGNTAKGFWGILVAYTFKDIGAAWMFASYNNEFVKLNKNWKLHRINLKIQVITPYREGWDKIGIVLPGSPSILSK